MNKTRSLSVPRNPLERLQELESSIETTVRPSLVENARTHARTNAPMHVRMHAHTNGMGEVAHNTLQELLKTPLQGELSRGPFQAATVRMPVEVWKRLDWVSSLTGRKKQDIIGEALVAYLERLRDHA
jgi:predicted DNA-binding protein